MWPRYLHRQDKWHLDFINISFLNNSAYLNKDLYKDLMWIINNT